MNKPKETKSCTNCNHSAYLRSQQGCVLICSKRSNLEKGKICIITPDGLKGFCRHWSKDNE